MKNNLIFVFLISFTVFTQPPKLLNFGASCYVNALLQSLYATKPLVENLPQLEFADQIGQHFKALINGFEEKNNFNGELLNFYKALVETFQPGEGTKEITEKRSTTLFTEKEQPRLSEEEEEIKRAIAESLKTQKQEQEQASKLAQDIARSTQKSPSKVQKLLRRVQEATQQDAGEFLGHLLEILRGLEKNKTYEMISQIFFHTMVTYLQSEGKPLRKKIAPQNSILSVPSYRTTRLGDKLKRIALKKFDDCLDDCLNEYFAKENYTDSEGKPATKTEYLQEISPIFIISLNKFYYDVDAGRTKKTLENIDIPLSISFKEYVVEDYEENTNYDLFAVIVHRGTEASSGHYVAYVKVKENGNFQWYECNDTIITPKTDSVVQREINKDGYILFYQREEISLAKPIVKVHPIEQFPLKAPKVKVIKEEPLREPEVKICPAQPKQEVKSLEKTPKQPSEKLLPAKKIEEELIFKTPKKPIEILTPQPLAKKPVKKKVLSPHEELAFTNNLRELRTSLRKLLSLLQR